MASRAISVKVSTAKVIKSLEDKLAEIETNYANQEKNEAEFKVKYDAWQKQLVDFAVANISKTKDLRTNYREWNQTLNVDFNINTTGMDFPKEPSRDFDQIGQYQYKESVEEISNAIRILKMTDEETVNASTFKSIAKYL